MAKYEYKFVSESLNPFKTFDYEKIIREHAEQGWRLVQVWTVTSITSSKQIIFEREI